ncbi:polysaccharide biosynthesis/export family protein [Spirosoma gilvum]
MLYSCASPKTITYFQGQGPVDTIRYSTLASIEPAISRIQTDDILAIVVSSLSEESNVLFNFSNTNALTTSSFPGTSTGAGSRNQPLGYLVDPMGNVEIPLVGKAKVAGMTLEEAGVFIKEKLSKYLKEPTVNVRQLNHKFTILGEVNRPGVYNLLDNHTTLPSIIGMAGDLTVYGRRTNVMLIRTTNEKREVFRVDLTSRQILDSPFYYIRNNDIIYVEPLPGRVTSTDRTVQLLPIFLGVTSTLLVIVNLILR